MTDTTANLALPLIAAAQAQKHVTHNEALQAIDVLLHCAVLDRDLEAPPGMATEGHAYIVKAPGTGAWAAQGNRIAHRQDGGWSFQAPKPGFIAFVLDEILLYFFDGAGWMSLAAALNAVQNLSRLGLGTLADATNPFSAKLNRALWTSRGAGEGGTGDLRVALNKEAESNVLSLLFQAGYEARAELGLVGGDDVTLRMGPDGVASYTGLRAHRDLHGRVALKEAMRKTCSHWMPQIGAAGANALGLGLVVTGTSSTTPPAAGTSFYAQAPRVRYVSSASAGSSAGAHGAGLGWWRGTVPNQGGFYFVIRAGLEVWQPNARWFAGLYGSASPIGNVNPSTLADVLGIGADSGDATLRLITNDASGAATRVDLGSGFPVGAHGLYELILSAEPNATSVQYRIERLNGGNVAAGTLASELPTPSAFLTPHLWANNGPSPAAIEVGLIGMYVESACLSGSRGTLS